MKLINAYSNFTPMILDTAQLTAIMKDRPNKKLVDNAQTYAAKLIMHITGVGVSTYMAQLPYFEKLEIAKVRENYARSNKDLFARVHRPIDKVFSAKGGSTYFNMPDSDAQQLRDALTDVEYGYSLRKWVENLWLSSYEYDPMGFVFIEIDPAGNPYPTYKSVMDVYDYRLNARSLEYIVFKTSQRIDKYKDANDKHYPIYRVVDDAIDALIVWDGSNVTMVAGEDYPNYFGKVPAMINSDIYDQVQGMYISPDDTVVQIADEILQEGSYFNIFKKYHFFPKAWQYQRKCITCEGSGVQQGQVCSSCKGTTFAPDWKVNETVQIPVPQSTDQPKLAPDVAGYITPDIKGWEAMATSLEDLEELMFYTMWGTLPAEHDGKGNETATGRFIDAQPVNERLNKFADAAETIEEFIINMMANIMFGQRNNGCDVNYGRRWLFEGPDAIWQKYSDARKAGAPMATLNELLTEYYQAKYTNDSIELKKYMRLMQLEPFVHYTVDQAQVMRIADADYLRKLYFDEWLWTLQPNDLLVKQVATLTQSLTDYVEKKQLAPLPVVQPVKTETKQTAGVV